MEATQKLCSFSCEINIFQSKNTEFKSPKNLFVRYYLSAGNNKRVRLNTRQISSTSEFVWNECFNLECLGTEDSIHSLKQATVVFELRRAKTHPVFGRSLLLGRAEIPWNVVFESPNMEIDRWVCLDSGNGCVREGFKLPKLNVGMRLKVPIQIQKQKRLITKWNHNHGCGSCHDHSKVCDFCGDRDFFALAAAMEFL